MEDVKIDKVDWKENPFIMEDYIKAIKDMNNEKFEQEYLGNFELIEDNETRS